MPGPSSGTTPSLGALPPTRGLPLNQMATTWTTLLSSPLSSHKPVIFSDRFRRIGMAIGPQTWFNDFFGANVSYSGTVLNNKITGAFGYGIAITSARNFTVQGNILFDNTTFIGSRGPNCSASDPTPSSAAFIVDMANVTSSTIQPQFQSVQDGKGLTCVQPPNGGDYWPYGGNPNPSNYNPPLPVSTSSANVKGSGGQRSAAVKAGLAISITFVVISIIVAALFARRWALNRSLARRKRSKRSRLRP
jgi:parallel beta-helix repeat protein